MLLRLPCPVGFCRLIKNSIAAGLLWRKAILRGLFFVEDGAAGTAYRNAWFNFFIAGGTLCHRLGIVKPGFFDAQLTSDAALEVGDEHGILGALPFEIGGGYQAALKFFEAAARVGEFGFGGLGASGDEDAVEASLPRVAVQLTREIFSNFLRGDVDLVDAFVTEIHHAFAGAKDSPGCGERTSSDPKYVRWRGGHFSVEMLTSETDFVSVAATGDMRVTSCFEFGKPDDNRRLRFAESTARSGFATTACGIGR